MYNIITVILLTAHVALVLGILMTKEDLPEEIQNCLDSVLIPGIRLRAYCKSYDENGKCIPNEGDGVRSDDELNCWKKIDELRRADHDFVKAYTTNEYIKVMKYDFLYLLPENARDCIDTMKPILQADFQSRRDCEAFLRTDDSENPDPYQECLDKIGDVFEHPQSLKCIEIAGTLSNRQQMFLQPYLFKVLFDL